MAAIDLTKYGITGAVEIIHNPSFDFFYEEEMNPALEGYEKGQMTELGAVNVMTGIFTGRSPKDKFIVMDENSKDTVWWNSEEYPNDNHVASQEAWDSCKAQAVKQLSGKKLYVMDAFCGANKDTRMAIRFIMEVAWQAHFVKNMFIIPTDENHFRTNVNVTVSSPFLGWIMSLGEDIQIVSPPSVVDMMTKEAHRLAAQYPKTDKPED